MNTYIPSLDCNLTGEQIAAMMPFTLCGCSYRTNSDGSAIVGKNARTWSRTYSLAVRSEARRILGVV